MKNTEIVITRTTQNPFGQTIVRGCCSCQHKTINLEGVRYCRVRRKVVGQMNICKEWQLTARLEQLRPGADKEAENSWQKEKKKNGSRPASSGGAGGMRDR